MRLKDSWPGTGGTLRTINTYNVLPRATISIMDGVLVTEGNSFHLYVPEAKPAPATPPESPVPTTTVHRVVTISVVVNWESFVEIEDLGTSVDPAQQCVRHGRTCGGSEECVICSSIPNSPEEETSDISRDNIKILT